MNAKSVIFIETAGNKANVFGNYMNLPLTGTLYLGTILHNHGYDVKIYNENFMPALLDPFELRADVFCISSLTVAANRARSLARQLKRIHPASTVLIGGIHATLRPEDFADVADHVVLGEAEGIIVDLVEGKFADKIVRGASMENLEDLPLINFRLLQRSEAMDILPIMTSRGCPFDCNFCTVTKVFGKQFRMQSPERIVAEIKNALSCISTRSVFFYDDNFTANRARVDKLCDLIIKEKLDISWSAQVRSDIGRDPELIAKMRRSGAHWFQVGFESINDASLKAMHKSQTRGDIEKAIRVIHQHGIYIHGMFIFGEDNDTVESLRETVDFAIAQEIDTVQFTMLTPFPGTQLHQRLVEEKRVYHSNWDYYDGMYAAFEPKNMSAARLQDEALLGYRRFYSLRRVSLDFLTLCFSVFMDALTWNFNRAYRYGFDVLAINLGAKFLVNRYARAYQGYLKLLVRAEHSHGEDRKDLSSPL